MEFVKLEEVNIERDILVVDKPKEWTSHDVVAKIRNRLSKKYGRKVKVGHGGTLDPFATGVLLILIGEATKRFEEIKDWEKEYVMKIKLGELTDTGDSEGRVIKKQKVGKVDRGEIEKVLKSFKGEYEQEVPIYSAVKVEGRRLYKLARAGEKVKLPKKVVKIKKIELINKVRNLVYIKVRCGSGTYMRQLAVDIGEKLDILAHAEELRRTRVGKYKLE